MSSDDTKRLQFNQYRKSDKAPFIIYAKLESSIVKINEYKNIPEKSSRTKLKEHILSGFSISTISSFKGIENKHDLYKGRDCMKKICEPLKENTQ